MEKMNFGQALSAIKNGKFLARAGWNGKGIFVFLIPDAVYGGWGLPKMMELGPFIAINTVTLQSDNASAPRAVVPWLASQTDILAEDWFVVG